MGNLMCNADESVCNTPFGNCSIKHCSCFGSKKKTRAAAENVQVRAEMALVAHLLRKKLADGPSEIAVEEYGNRITITVNKSVQEEEQKSEPQESPSS
jgi:hypothetical protein